MNAPKKSNTAMILVVVAVLAAGCLPCTGILAAIGIPAFISYVKRSKRSEAESNLRSLFTGAATYYADTHVGADGSVLTNCTVGPAVTPNIPGAERTVLGPIDPAFEALGFSPMDPVYFQYEIVAEPSRCGHGPDETIYSFRAHGDLDGDGITSLTELSIGTNALNELYRSPGFFIERELE